tara:strand:+ start:16231 stop:16590 length:360 start_codon:yes stop_codon:yes gene_type:complete
MDIIYLKDLRIDTTIGIYEWERGIRQTVILDIEMSADISLSAQNDDIEDTLNYKAVSKRIKSFVSQSNFKLVETLAESCARIIRDEFHVEWVRINLNKKGAISGASDVGVIIERGKLEK